MGKGDKKTKRGKIFRHSYGVSRPRRKKKKHFLSSLQSQQIKPIVEGAEKEKAVSEISETTEAIPVSEIKEEAVQPVVEVEKETTIIGKEKIEALEFTSDSTLIKEEDKIAESETLQISQEKTEVETEKVLSSEEAEIEKPKKRGRPKKQEDSKTKNEQIKSEEPLTTSSLEERKSKRGRPPKRIS